MEKESAPPKFQFILESLIMIGKQMRVVQPWLLFGFEYRAVIDMHALHILKPVHLREWPIVWFHLRECI